MKERFVRLGTTIRELLTYAYTAYSGTSILTDIKIQTIEIAQLLNILSYIINIVDIFP